ncbi:hypothetical protein IQ07DRAFT_583845 [Pyrenochaeta sp. DS3sAY3a]|nr:hypothetical protein IQ07DRAFT_583845 [Pyrenochaeta sp. DS3sAY3a]
MGADDLELNMPTYHVHFHPASPHLDVQPQASCDTSATTNHIPQTWIAHLPNRTAHLYSWPQ